MGRFKAKSRKPPRLRGAEGWEGANDGLPDEEAGPASEAGYLHQETRAFTRSKYACTPDSRALYTLAPAAATGWKGQKSLTPNPKLKALTRNEFRVGTEAAKRGRL
jgi:hypothetical protein